MLVLSLRLAHFDRFAGQAKGSLGHVQFKSTVDPYILPSYHNGVRLNAQATPGHLS